MFISKSQAKKDFPENYFTTKHTTQKPNRTILNYFEENIKKNDGTYKPITKEIMNIPKKNASLRYSLETCFYDRIAFHAFGIHLIKYFDKLISRRVFNHRLDQSLFKKKKHRYLFANPIEQWKKYEEFIRVGAIDKTILKTDIQDFYENIKITDLKKILLICLREVEVSSIEKATIRFCIDNICSCLETWSYNGTNGLPQNRDISSFLANIYCISALVKTMHFQCKALAVIYF